MADLADKSRKQTLKVLKARLGALEGPEDNTVATNNFYKKHKTVEHPDPAGNGDDVFKATNVRTVNRSPDHGYNPGEDAAVYEEVKSMTSNERIAYHKAQVAIHMGAARREKDPGKKKQLLTQAKRHLRLINQYKRLQNSSYDPEGNSITESKALLDRASSTAEENDGGLILTHKVKSKSGLTTTRQYQHVSHDEKASHWFPLGDHDHHLDAFSSDPKKSYKTISHEELGNMMDNGAHLDVLHHHHEEDEDGNLHISSDDYKTGATMRLNANGNPTNKTKKVTRSSRTGIYSSYEPQGNRLDEIFGLSKKEKAKKTAEKIMNNPRSPWIKAQNAINAVNAVNAAIYYGTLKQSYCDPRIYDIFAHLSEENKELFLQVLGEEDGYERIAEAFGLTEEE